MSEDIRFVRAPLVVEFEEIADRYEEFKREFDSLSEYEEDTIGQWLKLAKAKGETRDSDQVLLTLMVELHRKIDALTSLVKNEEKELVKLSHIERITDIGYDHFKLEKSVLTPGKEYYARVGMPVFPKREIPLFFTAIDENIAHIKLIHQKDTQDWSAYLMARERVMIRELKRGKKSV